MVYTSIRETLQHVLKNKINLVILFCLPVLVVVMMGIELDSEVITHVPIAVMDMDQTDFSRQLIDAFDQNVAFEIVAYPKDQASIESMIRNSEARAGLIIPKGFYQDVAGLESPSVLMIYDGSHMSYTGTAKAKAVEILLTFKAGAARNQIAARLGVSQDQALKMANVFSFQNRVLYNPAKSFEDFLAPILMAGYVQAALALAAGVGFNHDIYTYERKDRIGYGFGKILSYTLLGTLSYNICVALQVLVFKLPFRGSILGLELLVVGLCFAVSSFATLVSALIKNRIVALIGSGVIFIPNSIMAGTTWPLVSMPIGYQAFAKFTPFARFVVNFRGVYLKGLEMDNFSKDIAYLFLFGVIVSIIVECVLLLVPKEKGDEVKDDLLASTKKAIQVHI